MRWNPYLNAILASAYIWGIGLLIRFISMLHHDTPDNLVGSIAAISLVVLSAAVMGFLFIYRPVMLLIEGNKRESMFFLLKTIATFAAITFFVVLAVV